MFFDAYEIDSLSLCLILSYDKKYYYTSLNIKDTSIRIKYLDKVPSEILERILVESHLNAFYENMEKQILKMSLMLIFTQKTRYLQIL